MKTKEKILIFGGSGFLGKAFLDSLNLDNLDITIVDSSKSHIENNLVKYVEVDITDLKKMRSKLDKHYDYVFNFASIADIGEADDNFDRTIDVNVSGCLNTLKFCKTAKIKTYIYASSMYVFGDKGGVYGATKKISEMLVEKHAAEYSFDFTLLRYGSLYGPGAHKWNSIIKNVKTIKKDKSLTHWGNGNEVREYIHIKDAAKLTAQCLDGKYKNKIFRDLVS